MKKYILSTLILALIFTATPALAANTSGYAWSESVGYFDFSNATLSETALTGYAYNDNTGWLVLDGITHSNGTLSGYAWSESVGYFDFSDVVVSNGTFAGYAYNDNTGYLSFESTTVTTTYTTPVVEAPARRSSSGGSSVSSRIKNLTEQGNLERANELALQFPNATTLPTTEAELKAMIATLQAQIQALLAKQTPSSYTRDLDMGTQGADVTSLQNFLISKGYIIPAGATGYFGPQTQAALIKFQTANGIKPSVGYFGPITRAFISTLQIN